MALFVPAVDDSVQDILQATWTIQVQAARGSMSCRKPAQWASHWQERSLCNKERKEKTAAIIHLLTSYIQLWLPALTESQSYI